MKENYQRKVEVHQEESTSILENFETCKKVGLAAILAGAVVIGIGIAAGMGIYNLINYLAR